MIVRKTLLSIAAAGVMSTGFGGVALAAPAGPSAPAATAGTTAGKHHNERCATAAARTEKLEQRRVALEARIDKAQKAHAKAVAGHRDELATKIEGRLDKLRKAHERVTDRIARLHERCAVDKK